MTKRETKKIKLTHIPVEAYLEYALKFQSEEISLRAQFAEWLPDEIIDIHTHSNLKRHCLMVDKSILRLLSTFPWFEISDHIRISKILYLNKKVRLLVFSNPYRGINHRAVNDYLVKIASDELGIFPVLYGLPDDIDYTISQLKTRRFYGLKMYPEYRFPRFLKICEYYPDRILSFVEDIRIPIILHLPDVPPNCLDELEGIIQRFPRLRIILPHMGLIDFPFSGIEKVFSRVSRWKSVFLDTSMVTSSEVFTIALNYCGHRKILFGTDQPLNLIRGKKYIHPRLGARVATSYSYHWAIPEEQAEFSVYAINSTHIHWQVLSALRQAIASYSSYNQEEVKKSIFFENAKEVFGLTHIDKRK